MSILGSHIEIRTTEPVTFLVEPPLANTIYARRREHQRHIERENATQEQGVSREQSTERGRGRDRNMSQSPERGASRGRSLLRSLDVFDARSQSRQSEPLFDPEDDVDNGGYEEEQSVLRGLVEFKLARKTKISKIDVKLKGHLRIRAPAMALPNASYDPQMEFLEDREIYVEHVPLFTPDKSNPSLDHVGRRSRSAAPAISNTHRASPGPSSHNVYPGSSRSSGSPRQSQSSLVEDSRASNAPPPSYRESQSRHRDDRRRAVSRDSYAPSRPAYPDSDEESLGEERRGRDTHPRLDRANPTILEDTAYTAPRVHQRVSALNPSLQPPMQRVISRSADPATSASADGRSRASTPNDENGRAASRDRGRSRTRFLIKSLGESILREPSRSKSRVRDSSSGPSHAQAVHDDSDDDGDDEVEFQPGTYTYPFAIIIPAALPPSLDTALGHISYTLKGSVRRKGIMNHNLTSRIPLRIVGAPGVQDVESSENIIVSRTWDSQLFYHVVFSGKSIRVGAPAHITLNLTPIDKARIVRISIGIEQTTLATSERNSRLRLSQKKFFPLTPNLEAPNADSTLLPAPHNAALFSSEPYASWISPENVAQTISPEGPWILSKTLHVPKNPDLHPTLRSSKIHLKVTHNIKISIRIERGDDPAVAPAKPKKWDINIEAPLHVYAAETAQLELPSYSSASNTSLSRLHTPQVHKDAQKHKDRTAEVRIDDNYHYARLVAGLESPAGESPPPYEVGPTSHGATVNVSSPNDTQ